MPSLPYSKNPQFNTKFYLDSPIPKGTPTWNPLCTKEIPPRILYFSKEIQARILYSTSKEILV